MDDRFLKQFEAKHKFFCGKASQPISEVADLNQFREQGKVAAVMLAQLDEENQPQKYTTLQPLLGISLLLFIIKLLEYLGLPVMLE